MYHNIDENWHKDSNDDVNWKENSNENSIEKFDMKYELKLNDLD